LGEGVSGPGSELRSRAPTAAAGAGQGAEPSPGCCLCSLDPIFPWRSSFSGQVKRDGRPGTLPLPARPTEQASQSGKQAGEKTLAQGENPERTEVLTPAHLSSKDWQVGVLQWGQFTGLGALHRQNPSREDRRGGLGAQLWALQGTWLR
jgi:hypothetical protein